MTTARARYDLGLIIPTREEFDYMRRSVPFRPITDIDKGYWFEFSVPGQRWGVAHVLFDTGLVATTAAASRLLARFKPDILAVVGIGGGLSSKLKLGDVVVGSAVQEYMKSAKIASDPASGTVFEPSGASWPLAERLRNFANHFEYFDEDRYRSWVRFAKIRAVEDEIPLGTTAGARPEPGYFVLPIASGDFVVADPAFKQWLISHDRMRAVVEMESAGAARAVKEHDQDVPLLVLRGISDFADRRKASLDPVVFGGTSAAWRCYATQNAIELLIAFLSVPDFPWRTAEPALGAGAPAQAGTAGAGAADAGSRRAWGYFMQAMPLVHAATAVAGLVHTIRHDDHSPPADHPIHPDPTVHAHPAHHTEPHSQSTGH